MFRIRLLISLMSIFLMSCAATKMTAVRDPAASTLLYRNIVIIAPFSDLESRTIAENAFVQKLSEHGVQGISSITLFLPTRTYTEKELLSIIEDAGADGILFVILADAYTKQTYVPQSSTTTGTASLYGNILSYSSQTQHSGGYYISKPRVRYEIRLFDVSTGNTAWLATSLTRGNSFAGFNTLVQSLARTAVQKLNEDGLIP